MGDDAPWRPPLPPPLLADEPPAFLPEDHKRRIRRSWGRIAIACVGATIAAVSGQQVYERMHEDLGLHVGACVNALPTGEVHNDVDTVSCSGRHRAEVFAIVKDAAPRTTPYPGTALIRSAVQRCVDEYPTYGGTGLHDTAFNVRAIFPLEASWKAGYRTTVCLLEAPEGELVGSHRHARTGSVPSPERALLALGLGDCFDADRLGDGGQSVAVELVDCDRRHQFEVIGTAEAAASTTFDDARAFAEEACGRLFERFVGEPVDQSDLTLYWLVPPRDLWAAGDRRPICLVADEGAGSLTGTTAGLGNAPSTDVAAGRRDPTTLPGPPPDGRYDVRSRTVDCPTPTCASALDDDVVTLTAASDVLIVGTRFGTVRLEAQGTVWASDPLSIAGELQLYCGANASPTTAVLEITDVARDTATFTGRLRLHAEATAACAAGDVVYHLDAKWIGP